MRFAVGYGNGLGVAALLAFAGAVIALLTIGRPRYVPPDVAVAPPHAAAGVMPEPT